MKSSGTRCREAPATPWPWTIAQLCRGRVIRWSMWRSRNSGMSPGVALHCNHLHRRYLSGVCFLWLSTRSSGLSNCTNGVPCFGRGADRGDLIGASGNSVIRHFFTVDVEEFFQVSAFERWIPRDGWNRFERRAARSVRELLDRLDEHQAKGTFFVLGWLAEREPALVREIAERGHEIASHGWDHRRVTEQSPAQFRDSVRASRILLEQLTGRRVFGFRAPSFSIVRGLEWALDILIEEGYAYDSSLFPVQRRGYGYVGGETVPHWIARPAGRLAEYPPATVRWLGRELPAGGGAYFRILPYRFVAGALKRAQAANAPATFYIHPWEIDPGQPRVHTDLLTRLRHYTGLGRTLPRLERLLREFRFTAIAEHLAA